MATGWAKDDPYIDCDHYPKLAPEARNRRVWLGLRLSDPCDCGDCFACDGLLDDD